MQCAQRVRAIANGRKGGEEKTFHHKVVFFHTKYKKEPYCKQNFFIFTVKIKKKGDVR
jgi:hypothetical protein